MISFRKALFTLLAPLGAATIIGSGFATWVFGIQNVKVEGAVNNNVAVTPEVENGDIDILSCPSLLVFSEGNQGQTNLKDGISFYSEKTISQGKEFTVTSTDGSLISLVFDNTDPEKMYFSRKESSGSGRLVAGELSKFTKSTSAGAEEYVGTWEGSGIYENKNVNVTLTMAASGGNSSINLDFTGDSSITSTFTYSEKASSTIPEKITITDSTFAFRYTYKNKNLINEDATGYHLNVKMKLALESREPRKFRFTEDIKGNELVYQYQSGDVFTSFVLKKTDSDYQLDVNLMSNRLIFTIESYPDNTTENFPAGDYVGYTDNGIPCTLNYEPNNSPDSPNSWISIGEMDYYLAIVDLFKNRCDKDGYFNIFHNQENEDYAVTSLNIDIDKHLNADTPYIDFTCQLANYLRYASPDIKPVDYEPYLGLTVASILGGWRFRIIVSADFTSI